MVSSSVFLQTFPISNVQFLHPDELVHLNFLVPKDYNNNAELLDFDHNIARFHIVFMSIFALIYTFVLANAELLIYHDLLNIPKMFVNHMMTLLGIFFGQAQNIKTTFISRSFFGSFIIYSFFTGQIWQNALQSQLIAYDDNRKDIQSLQELHDTNLNLFSLEDFGKYLNYTANNCYDDCIHENLWKRLHNNSMKWPKLDGTMAFLKCQKFSDIIIEVNSDSNKGHVLHKIPQIFYSSYVSMIASKSFPWFDDLNDILMGFHENGLSAYYLQKSAELMDIVMIRKNILGLLNDKIHYIGLWEIRVLIFPYLFFNSVALIIFVIEYTHKRIQRSILTMSAILWSAFILILKIIIKLLCKFIVFLFKNIRKFCFWLGKQIIELFGKILNWFLLFPKEIRRKLTNFWNRIQFGKRNKNNTRIKEI